MKKDTNKQATSGNITAIISITSGIRLRRILLVPSHFIVRCRGAAGRSNMVKKCKTVGLYS
jgi:hypothetical protein